MTGKEQVQEMARIIGCCKSYLHPDIKCHSKEYGCYCAENPCYNERVALRLYSKSYRKASEVAKKIFAEIEEVLENIGYWDEIDFKSLKKKYTEEQNNEER